MGKTGPKPKAECGKGHPLSGDNLYEVYSKLVKRVVRQCKECRRMQMKRYKERQMEKSIAKFRELQR